MAIILYVVCTRKTWKSRQYIELYYILQPAYFNVFFCMVTFYSAVQCSDHKNELHWRILLLIIVIKILHLLLLFHRKKYFLIEGFL